MFKNLVLFEVISSAIKAFEKDLSKFNFRKIITKEEFKSIEVNDKSKALLILSNSLNTFVNSIPKFKPFDLTKCYRFNSDVQEKDNHRLITVYAIKYIDQECSSFDAFSLIFTTYCDELESFKFELTQKEKEGEQKLNFRLIVRNNGELTLEFFNNNDSKEVQLIELLEAMSKVTTFDFNKHIVFALGGAITHSKEL